MPASRCKRRRYWINNILQINDKHTVLDKDDTDIRNKDKILADQPFLKTSFERIKSESFNPKTNQINPATLKKLQYLERKALCPGKIGIWKCWYFRRSTWRKNPQHKATTNTAYIYRGYYTVVRRYEFYVRVARTISHE